MIDPSQFGYDIGGILAIALVVIGIFTFRKRLTKNLSMRDIRRSVEPQEFTAPHIPIEGTPAKIDRLEELPIGSKIAVELTKVKGKKRIVIVRGKAAIRPGILGSKEIFFFVWNRMAYFIKPNKIIEVQQRSNRFNRRPPTILKLIYDILYSEPLNMDGSITWDDELERIMVDSGMDQYIVAATLESGFQLTPGLLKIIIVVGVLSGFFGLALNGTAQLTPTVIVHWLPRG